MFKGFVEQLARDKGREKDMTLYNNIEKIAPKLIAKQRQIFKGVSPNIDFYSGFVYDMLNIPRELYTPLFAIARIAGWSAHRLEEFLKSVNVESIFEFIERTDYLFLYSIKECVEKSDCHEGVYLSEVAEYMKLSIPETSKMVKSLENKGYIIWKLDEKKERTYLVLTNKAIELSNCQKEKMIEAYEKIISNIQEDDLAVTQCTLRKIRQLMEEIK